MLGVEVHENVGFESLIEPPEDQSQESMFLLLLVVVVLHFIPSREINRN